MLPNIYQCSIFPKPTKKIAIKEIKNLKISKAVKDSDSPVNSLKENAEFFDEQVCCQFNEAIYSSIFPASFKLANITPAFKIGYRNQKRNYIPTIHYHKALHLGCCSSPRSASTFQIF